MAVVALVAVPTVAFAGSWDASRQNCPGNEGCQRVELVTTSNGELTTPAERTRGFVDADGDGECDNAGSVDKEQGRDVGAHPGRGNGNGFIDLNRDGICDNNQTL